eukprot:2273192-Pyramimonas_sp.AAC.1
MQWCDARDTVADGHARSSIPRHLSQQVMAGTQSFKRELKTYAPYRVPTSKVGPGSLRAGGAQLFGVEKRDEIRLYYLSGLCL